MIFFTHYLYWCGVQGPYDEIPALYIAILACWAVLGLGWWYITDVMYKDEALAVSRSLLVVPILRTITATAALVFWVECSGEGDMCSTDTASGLAMLYPFAEAGEILYSGLVTLASDDIFSTTFYLLQSSCTSTWPPRRVGA